MLTRAISTPQNLLAKAPASNAPAMLGAKCLPLVEALASRKWSDEEIEEDIAAIKEVLAEKLKGMRCVHVRRWSPSLD